MARAIDYLSMTTRFVCRAFCAFAFAGSTLCAAQNWLTKAIKLVTPFPHKVGKDCKSIGCKS